MAVNLSLVGLASETSLFLLLFSSSLKKKKNHPLQKLFVFDQLLLLPPLPLFFVGLTFLVRSSSGRPPSGSASWRGLSTAASSASLLAAHFCPIYWHSLRFRSPGASSPQPLQSACVQLLHSGSERGRETRKKKNVKTKNLDSGSREPVQEKGDESANQILMKIKLSNMTPNCEDIISVYRLTFLPKNK